MKRREWKHNYHYNHFYPIFAITIRKLYFSFRFCFIQTYTFGIQIHLSPFNSELKGPTKNLRARKVRVKISHFGSDTYITESPERYFVSQASFRDLDTQIWHFGEFFVQFLRSDDISMNTPALSAWLGFIRAEYLPSVQTFFSLLEGEILKRAGKSLNQRSSSVNIPLLSQIAANEEEKQQQKHRNDNNNKAKKQ